MLSEDKDAIDTTRNGVISIGVLRKVGYQGEPGAYSEVASLKLEPGATLVPCRTLAHAFNDLSAGVLDAIVVPVENSLAGSIGETYDLLLNTGVVVTGEAVISVDHCLMARPGTSLEQVKRALSHPQALAQCQRFLAGMGIEPVPHYDTAGSAKALSETDMEGTAAIASLRAAQIYGLQVLETGIQSSRENFTRFYRVEPNPRKPGQKNKSVFAVSLAHHAGSLFMALSSFACRGVNLTKIESRPVQRDPWEYVFFLEFEGHTDEWRVKDAINELKSKASMLKVLGSFATEG